MSNKMNSKLKVINIGHSLLIESTKKMIVNNELTDVIESIEIDFDEAPLLTNTINRIVKERNERQNEYSCD